MKSAVRMLRVVAAIAAAAGAFACAEPTLAPPVGSSGADLYNQVWHEVDLNYSMFALKRVAWDSVRAATRPLAIAATSDAALARVLGDMLVGLHDRHVSLTPGPGSAEITYRTASDLVAPAYDAALVGRRYLLGDAYSPGPHVSAGLLSPTVGYIRIPSFVGSGWSDEIDGALRWLGGVKAIVIDVRCNPGGDYDVALQVAGRFADKTRTFGWVKVRNGPAHGDFTPLIAETVQPDGPAQFHGPVFVLTNRQAYSSAENFTLAMRALPNVTTVGDTTAGSSGKPIVRELPNGWTYQISSWLEYTPANVPYEDVGLAPDVYVRARVEDVRAGVDPVLERADALASVAASARR
jgi:carboxyl-terminal processing protease